MIETKGYVDTAALDELKEALGEDLAEIVDQFLLQLDGMVRAVEAALEADNPSDAAAHAHALKGTAANLGATALAGVSAEIEHLAKIGDMESGRQRCASLSVIATASARVIREGGYSSY